jgi:ubiquinone/menaquinone biosynthesis C-methylase UbiE
MDSQKHIFQQSEADAYFLRNKAKYVPAAESDDLLVKQFQQIALNPGKTLEIGCSNGLHLAEIRAAFGCECVGIDPSPCAIEDGAGRFPEITLLTGTADQLPFEDASFDTIIFGFCLYLCDRSDLFKIAYEADRCLRAGGNLVIKDFLPPFPYANPYAHQQGITAYKMNYGAMFSWNPAYTEIAKLTYSHGAVELRDLPDERICTLVFRKLPEFAYPTAPFSKA